MTTTAATYRLWACADLTTHDAFALSFLATAFERMRKAAFLAERAGLKWDTAFDGESYDLSVDADDLPALLTLASQLEKGHELIIDALDYAGELDQAMSAAEWRDFLGWAR